MFLQGQTKCGINIGSGACDKIGSPLLSKNQNGLMKSYIWPKGTHIMVLDELVKKIILCIYHIADVSKNSRHKKLEKLLW